MYSVFHQSGTRGEVRVVDIVVVHGAVGVDVVRVVCIRVRGAQAPVDGANRPYPNERQQGVASFNMVKTPFDVWLYACLVNLRTLGLSCSPPSIPNCPGTWGTISATTISPVPG